MRAIGQQPIIRTCSEADLAKLHAIFPCSSHSQRFNNQLAGAVEYLIAWVNDEPAGYFLLHWQGQQIHGAPEVSSGMVRPDFRSRGIGSALIAECENLAGQRGANQICLLVSHDNPRARCLYERLGYRLLKDVTIEYNSTHAAGKAQQFQDKCALLIKGLPDRGGFELPGLQ